MFPLSPSFADVGYRTAPERSNVSRAAISVVSGLDIEATRVSEGISIFTGTSAFIEETVPTEFTETGAFVMEVEGALGKRSNTASTNTLAINTTAKSTRKLHFLAYASRVPPTSRTVNSTILSI